MTRALITGLFLVVLSGCASPRAVPPFRGQDGAPSEWAELVAEAAGADAVIIGEMHGHRRGLAAALWRDLLEQTEDPALSLEFFDRRAQPSLDAYLAGQLSEPGLMKETGRTARNFPRGHRRMVRDAGRAGAPVYASNAPREFTGIARREGFSALEEVSEADRLLFTVPERVPEGRYREDFFERMRDMPGHGPDDEETPEELLEGFYRSQVLWDSTMADTIVRALEDGHRPVVHVVGRFHSDFDGGLVQLLRAGRQGVRIVTISMVASGEAALRQEDHGRADFVLYVGD